MGPIQAAGEPDRGAIVLPTTEVLLWKAARQRGAVARRQDASHAYRPMHVGKRFLTNTVIHNFG
jgi:hypothetical protein